MSMKADRNFEEFFCYLIFLYIISCLISVIWFNVFTLLTEFIVFRLWSFNCLGLWFIGAERILAFVMFFFAVVVVL